MGLPVEAVLRHDLLSKRSPIEKRAVVQRSMNCIFSFIMQLSLQWFLKQSGQENVRDWLNIKGFHIFTACPILTQMLNSAALAQPQCFNSVCRGKFMDGSLWDCRFLRYWYFIWNMGDANCQLCSFPPGAHTKNMLHMKTCNVENLTANSLSKESKFQSCAANIFQQLYKV